jgi:hypothetical protein
VVSGNAEYRNRCADSVAHVAARQLRPVPPILTRGVTRGLPFWRRAMPILSHPAFGPRTALGYVTGGTLLTVWTLVWYFTISGEMTQVKWFLFLGLLLTGVTFVFLGLVLGPLGRAARQAELPPSEALRAEATIQHAAAAHAVPPAAVMPPAAAPAMPVAPVAAAPAAPQVTPVR